MTSRIDMKMPDLTSRRYRYHYLTALNLLESMGIPPENIDIRAVGIHENYRGEIRSQAPEAGAEITGGTEITLDVGCESAIDFMPYQFFYGLQGLRDTDSTWEERARNLMAPFDAAVIRYEAALRMHSLRNSFGVNDEDHLRRFMALFEYDPGAGERSVGDLKFLAALLPTLNSWGGNPVAVAAVLERLTGFRIRMKGNVKAKTGIPAEIRYSLGSRTGRLGCETIVGSTFEEFDSTYEVSFVGVPRDRVSELLPGGKTLSRVEGFLDFCMPGDLDYRITIEVDREGDGDGQTEGILAGESVRRGRASSALGHLGYSTYI
ncbi:MAG: hypothetical protein GY835_27770 [bacterium]|nr:hypothetical protein [bacterium]